jgi:hypothetical protein
LSSRFWGNDAARLHAIFSKAAELVFSSSDPQRALYSVSITHEEAYYGIDSLDSLRRTDSVAVVIRNLEGIENADISHPHLKYWIDITQSHASKAAVVNIPSVKALWAEKQAIFASVENSQTFDVTAFTLPFTSQGSIGIDAKNRIHRTYLQQFLDHVTGLMTHSIDKISASGGISQYCEKDIAFREAIAHNAFAFEKSRVFAHTDFTQLCVNDIVEYVDFDRESPFTDGVCPYFVLVGSSGTGKTSLMATALHAVKSRWTKANTIIRFR